MRKLTLTLTAAAFALGTMAFAVNAQTQQLGAASLHAQLQNATPIVRQIACNGRWGPWCRPGWVRRCRRGFYGYRHCRCVPCY